MRWGGKESRGGLALAGPHRKAATLRGRQAQAFLAEVESGDEADLQQLMARLTGNYKRGNERTAKNHPRNR